MLNELTKEQLIAEHGYGVDLDREHQFCGKDAISSFIKNFPEHAETLHFIRLASHEVSIVDSTPRFIINALQAEIIFKAYVSGYRAAKADQSAVV